MSKAPERVTIFYGGPGTRAYWRPDADSMVLPDDAILPTECVRADRYDEAIRQRDACLRVVRNRRAAVESRLKLLRVQLSDLTDDGARAQRMEMVKVVEADLARLTQLIADCEGNPPSLPRADVKTETRT